MRWHYLSPLQFTFLDFINQNMKFRFTIIASQIQTKQSAAPSKQCFALWCLKLIETYFLTTTVQKGNPKVVQLCSEKINTFVELFDLSSIIFSDLERFVHAMLMQIWFMVIEYDGDFPNHASQFTISQYCYYFVLFVTFTWTYRIQKVSVHFLVASLEIPRTI